MVVAPSLITGLIESVISMTSTEQNLMNTQGKDAAESWNKFKFNKNFETSKNLRSTTEVVHN